MARSTSTPATDVAKRNAAAIQMLWDIGQESLQTCPADRFGYGTTTKAIQTEIARLERKYGLRMPVKLNMDALPKIRRIAIDYDAASIRRIALAVVKHCSPFATTHMYRLLAVQGQAKRSSITQKAIEERWSAKRLREEIQGCLGRRRANVGRRPSVPKGKRAVLMTLHRQIESWQKWTAIALPRLPEDIQVSLKRIGREMTALTLRIVPSTSVKV